MNNSKIIEEEIYKRAFVIFVTFISVETNISYEKTLDMISYDVFISDTNKICNFLELAKKQLRKEKLTKINRYV